mmetsp:Transcript_50231/g.106719  ORF Transcript_50231/g.106719 Transcript_50231/m.106719 type:complete len:258 (-) Transcript_50231:362-1135(-)
MIVYFPTCDKFRHSLSELSMLHAISHFAFFLHVAREEFGEGSDGALVDAKGCSGFLMGDERISDDQMLFLSHDLRRLPQTALKGRIEGGVLASAEPHGSLKRDRNTIRCGFEESAGNLLGRLEVQSPEGKSDVVPTEVPQSPEGLGAFVEPNVGGPLGVISEGDREARDDVFYFSEAGGGNCLLHLNQSLVVHEHRVVHVLHPGLAARVQNFFGVLQGACERLLGEDVLACCGGFANPLLLHHGGQGDVDYLHVGIS